MKKTTKPTTCKKTKAPCQNEQRINSVNNYVAALNQYVNEVATSQEDINHRSKVGLWLAIVAFVVSVGHAIIAITN